MDTEEEYTNNPAKFHSGGLIIRRNHGQAVFITVHEPTSFQIVVEKGHVFKETKLRFLADKEKVLILREEKR